MPVLTAHYGESPYKPVCMWNLIIIASNYDAEKSGFHAGSRACVLFFLKGYSQNPIFKAYSWSKFMPWRSPNFDFRWSRWAGEVETSGHGQIPSWSLQNRESRTRAGNVWMLYPRAIGWSCNKVRGLPFGRLWVELPAGPTLASKWESHGSTV
jgi:hypothetical protein